MNQTVKHIHNHSRAFLNSLGREAEKLSDDVRLMIDVLKEQQQYSNASEALEATNLNQVIQHVLRVKDVQLRKSRINLVCKLAELPEVTLQKAKFMRVFHCLLQNAEEAIEQGEISQGSIEITSNFEHDTVRLLIRDNGVGIENSHFHRIFSHGYSTKGRRGFGLHYAGNAIKEMNGSIQLNSQGLNQGAEVVIEFPLSQSHVQAKTG